MDLSLLPSPGSDFNKQRTGALFNVCSANSPSYSLNRRPGVRKPRGFSEEEREHAKEVRERERYGARTTSIKPSATVFPARITSINQRGHSLEKDPLGDKMTSKLNQNSPAEKTITDSFKERGGNTLAGSRGRTELRRYNLLSRSRSLDWKAGERSLRQGKGPDLFTSSMKKTGLEEKTGLEGTRGKFGSSIQVYYNSTNSVIADRNPVSHGSHTLDRIWGGSLPLRIRSQSGPCSYTKVSSASLGPKGGKSILERIEKLYGSTGFGHMEDGEATLTHPQRRSYDWSAGGTFPRRSSSDHTSSLYEAQGRSSSNWAQKGSLSSEMSPLSSRFSERVSGGQWQIHGAYLRRGLSDVGTMSLDRARSRNTVAARIRAARAAEGITPPQLNSLFDEKRSTSWRDSYGLRERRLSGSDECVNYGKEKGETKTMNGTLRERHSWLELKGSDEGVQAKMALKSVSSDDVFESNPQKITTKAEEKKKIPERLSSQTPTSVRNKINQFEALTQRSQGLAIGQVLMQRRAYSVPTQLSNAHDEVKKGGSVKAMGGYRDKWDDLKSREEKREDRVAGALKKHGSDRSPSVEEVGLRVDRREREGKDEPERGKECAEDKNYSILNSNLEIPLNEDPQTQRGTFYIDEMDFSKASSPEEKNERPTSLPITSTCFKNKITMAISPVIDEDITPTNTPDQSPFLSPQPKPANPDPVSETEITPVLTQDPKTHEPDSPPQPSVTLSHSTPTDQVSSDVKLAYAKAKKQVLDLEAWVAGLNPKINLLNDEEDDYDDDESTQKDEDSNYDSDSGESSVTVTSNMSQDRKSFCVSLSDLCNFAGVDYESENDSDEWQSTGRRSASLSSDMSALSHVSVLPTEELDRLLEDVRSLGDNTLQDYNDVHVVVLHKEMGVGLGFSLAGGTDQNKPVTVHKVFHLGVAAKEGAIREGDQVLSINGTALTELPHWEALRVLRRAKTRDLGVVVLRRGEISSGSKRVAQTNNRAPTETRTTETGQCVCVRLEKNSRDLGFSLEGGVDYGQENRPLTVQKIFQGGPVDEVQPGDEVMEIEGVSLVGMRRLEAWTLIRRLPPGPVDVVLRRPH